MSDRTGHSGPSNAAATMEPGGTPPPPAPLPPLLPAGTALPSPFASTAAFLQQGSTSRGASLLPPPTAGSAADDGVGGGRRLALQESLQRRPSSSASDRPSLPLPPRPSSAASDHPSLLLQRRPSSSASDRPSLPLPRRPSSSASDRPQGTGSRPASAASHRSGASGGGPLGRPNSLLHTNSTWAQTLPRRLSMRGRPTSEAGSAQSGLLESVRSQLQEAAVGSCQCRVLLPGVDLADHGLAELQELASPGGGDLAVLTAPRGMDLREAMSQAYSYSQMQLEGGSSVSCSQWQQHAPASVPGTPASLPCGMGTAAGTPLAPPGQGSSAPGSGAVFSLPQQQQQSWWEGSSGPAGADGGNVAPALVSAQPQQPGDVFNSDTQQAGTSNAAEAAAPNALMRPAPIPTSDLPEVQLPAVQVPGGQRPWTYDGTLASLAVPRSLKPSPLEVAYRARAAARMWPMLAPFVPRMLRKYILQAGPPAGSLQDAESLVHLSVGRAVACRSSASPQSLSRAMRPSMDTFPAAVMIADVSGFTALTEALGGQGSAGVELLTKCMNRYFTQVIDLLLLYGGDVEKFAGDCMIVVFAPTWEEAQGSDDGGLAAATLRAVTCGSQLATRFGAMRMLPNGEVVPIPAAERWAAEAEEARAAAAAAEEEHPGLRDRLEDLRDKLAAPAGKLAAPAGKALVRGGGMAARAAGGVPRATAAVLGGGMSVAAGGMSVAAGGVAVVASSPARLVGRGGRATKSDAHLSVAASTPVTGEEAVAGLGAGASGISVHTLLRAHSSPDSSLLLLPTAAEAEAAAAGVPQAAAQSKAPVLTLLRQGSGLDAAVLSRLSRVSSSNGSGGSPGSGHRQRSSFNAPLAGRRQRSGLGCAPAGAAEPTLEEAVAAAAATVAAEDATAAASAAVAVERSSSLPGATTEQRQQRERRLHEQALAELAVLAGPAGALRPPELPSAAGAAEVAELRLQEQLALYHHRRHPSLPKNWDGQASRAAAAAGDGRVHRTATAPASVTAQLAMMAAADQRQQQQRQQLQHLPEQERPLKQLERQEQAVPAAGRSRGLDSAEDAPLPDASASFLSLGASSSSEPQRPLGLPRPPSRRPLPPVPSGVSFGGGSEPLAPLSRLPAVDSGSLPPLGLGSSGKLVGVDGDTAAAAPDAAMELGNAAAQLASRPSILRRLFSTASKPWRGRSVSSTADVSQAVGCGGGAEGCQSSGTSMYSVGSVGPWAASLAELSSGLGLPGSVSSQGISPPSASRPRPRRGGGQNRRSSGGWPWSPGAPPWGMQGGGSYSSVRPAASGPCAAQRSPFAEPPPASTVSASPDIEAGGAGPMGPGGLGSGPAGGGGQQVAAMQVVLSLKVMVAAGSVCAFHVGGGQESAAVDDTSGVPRWEFFIGDPPQPSEEPGRRPRPPIAQLQATERYAVSGEAVLSPEAAELVGSACLQEPLGGGTARLLQVLEPYTLPHEAAEEAGAPSLERAARQVARERAALGTLPEAAQGHALQLLRMHLLENVRVRVEAGHIDYVNELRVGTVLFLGFPSLLEPPPAGAARTGLGAVQACMEAVQKRMRQHDGSFLQFRCDEKGFLAICAFGLPGRSHEDGPARGIQAALAIVEAVRRRGGRACCGVTTGQLFCAMVGSQRRSEYTVFGNAINLSARLMVRACDRLADLYCDATTQQLAKHKAVYRQLDPVRVKGRQLPVDIFEVTSLHAEAAGGKHPTLSPLGPPPLSLLPDAKASAPAAAARGLSHGGSASLAVSGESVGTLAPQLLHQSSLPGEHQQPPPQWAQGTGAGQAGNEGLLDLGDRLLSIASTVATPMRLMPHTPMIARDAELGAITQRCVDLVRSRQGGVVMVEGDAGMGKSRLVEELQHSELGGVYDSCNLFIGLGRRERKSQALYPWRRVLREMFHHDRQLGQAYVLRGTDPVVVATELALRLQEGVPDYAQWRHLLADALDLPLSEFPPALPTLQQHRQRLLEQRRIQSITPLRNPTPESLDLFPTTLASALDQAAMRSDGLGEEEEAFLSGADRAKSFAARMKRSASLGLMEHSSVAAGGSPPATVDPKALLRAATPSPGKLAKLRQHHATVVWRQAQAAAEQQCVTEPSGSPLPGGLSGEEEVEGGDSGYTSSEAGSYSSRASSFSVSAHSTHGSPTAAHASLGLEDEEGGDFQDASTGGSPTARSTSGGSWKRRPDHMQRSATSRGGVGLTLLRSSPGREISTHLRAKKVQELVIALISQFTQAYGPLVLVLEDLHHFDTASWRLLSSAVNDASLHQSVLFIVTYRPYFGVLAPMLRQRGGSKELFYHRVQAAYRALLALPSTLHLKLQPFDADQSRQFVSAALGGAQVPPEVAVLLWERSNGLPSFLEQLVVFLQLFVQTQLQAQPPPMAPAAGDPNCYGPGGVPLSGALGSGRRRSTVEEVQAVARAGLDFIANNVSIHSIITDRVDRLRPEEQLTLKVASVLGLTVYRQLLQATHPQHPSLQALEGSLCALEAASFLRQDPLDAATWRFCQVLARDVVYELVPKELRRDWHAAAAAAMEAYSSDQIHLPASTIAWHWAQSCRDVEAPQWQRSFRAVEWWQRAALASLENGAYADALPLLQKAQDVAEALERYFADHSRSFWLMRRQQTQQAGAGVQLEPGMPGAQLGSASVDTAASTHGSALLAPDGGPLGSTELQLAAALPLVPRLRRAHWERCMAAMCIAVELSAESLHEAKTHCLLALYLLGVPLPSSEEYLTGQKQGLWWSRRGPLAWLTGAAQRATTLCRSDGNEVDPLQQRAADLDAGAYAWMARPTVLAASAGGRWGGTSQSTAAPGFIPLPGSAAPSLLGGSKEQQWQRPASSGGTFGSSLPWPPPRGWGSSDASMAAASLAARRSGASNTPAALPPASLVPPSAARTAQQQQQQQRPPVQVVRLGPGSTGAPPSLLQPSPFELPGSAAQLSVASGSGTGASLPSAAAWGPSGGTKRSAGSSVLGLPPSGASTYAGTLGVAPEPASMQLPPSHSPTMGMEASQQFMAWQAAGMQAAAAAASAAASSASSQQAEQAEAASLQQQASQTFGQEFNSLSVMPTQSGNAELAGGASYEQLSLVAAQRQEHARKQVVASALAGGDQRYPAEARAEAALVLDLLCSLLLAPAQPDAEGLRYLRWVCRHLQGGRVTRRSPYWQTYTDAGLALKRRKQQQRVRAAQSASQQSQQQDSSSQGGGLLRLARLPVPQTLSSIAGAVSGAFSTEGRLQRAL